MEQEKQPDIRVKNTPAFKLKDKPRRRFVAIHLRREFGFMPETIIVEKVSGRNNTFFLRAILTEEEMKKEDERKIFLEQQKLEVEQKKHGKKKPSTNKKT